VGRRDPYQLDTAVDPSSAWTCLRWEPTVCGERKSLSAVARFVRPAATSRTTRRSARGSECQPVPVPPRSARAAVAVRPAGTMGAPGNARSRAVSTYALQRSDAARVEDRPCRGPPVSRTARVEDRPCRGQGLASRTGPGTGPGRVPQRGGLLVQGGQAGEHRRRLEGGLRRVTERRRGDGTRGTPDGGTGGPSSDRCAPPPAPRRGQLPAR
jgi:hypothetical protein